MRTWMAVIDAFVLRQKRAVKNTRTRDGVLTLHHNTIAEWRRDKLWITNAGWPTVTTKARLNALPGVSLSSIRSVWHLNGKPWNGRWICVNP